MPDPGRKQIEELRGRVGEINALEAGLQGLSDADLASKTAEFKSRLAQGQTLDDILPEAFAVVREAARRQVKMRPFDVQLMGGLVLNQGKIAEMATGEGKTLVATLPAYLNALTGQGVHIVTVNDYLAKRDSQWMGPIYQSLGLTVGLIQHDHDYDQRRQAYAADITYGTNNEFGFDYLRDNMAVEKSQCVQRELNYAIVDEVDSILIDEARTPLIISGMARDTTDQYRQLVPIVRALKLLDEKTYKKNQQEGIEDKETDATFDEKSKNVALTENGEQKIAARLGLKTLSDLTHIGTAHMAVQLIRALRLYKRDVDYVVKDGEIIIVDEFTGRLMFGRRYSEGLHQAIEAMEGVKVRQESQTLATITFQNYFRMFKKLSGMTGTALTEEAEFGKIYNLPVVTIPTNKPLIRISHPDVVYRTRKEKYNAVIDEIVDWHAKGRPVLVGTISIEASEDLSKLLSRKNIPHTVLNAKYHEKEAQIIAQAGQKNAVTIATNMAGRGTDIVLGPGVTDLGGLHIMGTERHESRRIDNQLRGRSGRQGDPGSSRFYVSLEDDLMRLFGSERISNLMLRMGLPEGTPIEHGLISGAIERAQKKVEQYHFSIREQVLKYDDVMNKQRETIYSLRQKILREENLAEKVAEAINSVAQEVFEGALADQAEAAAEADEGAATEEELAVGQSQAESGPSGWAERLARLLPEAARQTIGKMAAEIARDDRIKDEEVVSRIAELIRSAYQAKEASVSEGIFHQLERLVLLRVIDSHWIDHLHNMDVLREGIGLRAYAQRDPLVEYKIEAFEMFQAMLASIREEFIGTMFKVQVVVEQAPPAPFLMMARPMAYSGGELPSGLDVNRSRSEAGPSALPPALAQRQMRPGQGSGLTGFDEAAAQAGAPVRAQVPRPEAAQAPVHREEPKIGRNDPCPCGSGKKYKKCCGAKG